VRLDRVAARKDDASDADAAVVRAQASLANEAIDWRRLDVSGGSQATFEAARALLGLPK
jgi:hypothetical protein